MGIFPGLMVIVTLITGYAWWNMRKNKQGTIESDFTYLLTGYYVRNNKIMKNKMKKDSNLDTCRIIMQNIFQTIFQNGILLIPKNLSVLTRLKFVKAEKSDQTKLIFWDCSGK